MADNEVEIPNLPVKDNRVKKLQMAEQILEVQARIRAKRLDIENTIEHVLKKHEVQLKKLEYALEAMEDQYKKLEDIEVNIKE